MTARPFFQGRELLMRLRILGLAAVIALAWTAQTFSRPQDQDDVRGAFLTSREKTASKPANSATASRPSRRRPKTTATKPPAVNETPTTSGASSGAATTSKDARAPQQR